MDIACDVNTLFAPGVPLHSFLDSGSYSLL